MCVGGGGVYWFSFSAKKYRKTVSAGYICSRVFAKLNINKKLNKE